MHEQVVLFSTAVYSAGDDPASDRATPSTGPGHSRLWLRKLAARTMEIIHWFLLPMQQAAVLRQQTPLRIGQYYGNMGTDDWKLPDWQKQLDQNDVLVMTYQVLLNALGRGFIQVCYTLHCTPVADSTLKELTGARTDSSANSRNNITFLMGTNISDITGGACIGIADVLHCSVGH